jgi:hypothetical protein
MSDCSPHDANFTVPEGGRASTVIGAKPVEKADFAPASYDPEKDPALLEANALMNAYFLEQVGYVPANSVLDIAEAKRKMARSELQKPMKATTLRKGGGE